MKVVLSHPYSGALHWWFGELSNPGHFPRTGYIGHEYYRSLFEGVDKNLDMALLSAVVFDELVIPAADAAFPQDSTAPDGAGRVSSLEITADWRPIQEADAIVGANLDTLVNDEQISELIGTLSEWAQRLELQYAIADVSLALEHDAPVICSPGRRALVRRLIEIGIVDVSRDERTALEGANVIAEGIEGYAKVTGLRFDVADLAGLAAIKADECIREYSDGFRTALLTASNSSELWESISNAMVRSKQATRLAGTFQATSRSAGPLGLLPGIGTITGVAGMAADAAAEIAERVAKRAAWFELAGEVQAVRSRQQLIDHLLTLGYAVPRSD